MNHHKNARLTFARRLEMVHLMTEQALTPAAAALAVARHRHAHGGQGLGRLATAGYRVRRGRLV